MAATSPQDVLAFWFGPAMGMEQWFKVDEAFDTQVRESLGPIAAEAATGALDRWTDTAEGALALVLLLDQAPRNIHRGTPAAWAGDAAARTAARRALRRGHDLATDLSRRFFFYLPFEHSEILADQFLSEALFATLQNKDFRFYAMRHREIVERFGRFPHRNKVLGRATTEAEQRFLEEPHSSF